MFSKKEFKTKRSASSLVLAYVLMGLAALSCLHQLVVASPESGSAIQSAESNSVEQFGSPKRQYLIAPRIGRSLNNNAAIWSALEEGAFNRPGQVQPHRGFPGPLRSSLFLLVGNRRLIGPRSGGLLPQARIGRRASPSGLLPQPRVGRRSDPSALVMEPMSSAGGDGDDDGGQQEVAVATMSDSSALTDAVESLLNE